MYIPKWAILALQLVGATILGWMLHMGVGPETALSAPEPASATTGSVLRPTQDAPTPTPPTPATAAPAPTPVYVTLVMGDDATNPDAGEAVTRFEAPQPVRAARPAPPPAPVHTQEAPTEINASGPVSGMSIIANGDHIVIASDGSIVAAGDNPVVRGNTGDASSSGTIAIDPIDSEVVSGSSQSGGGAGRVPPATSTTDAGSTPTTAGDTTPADAAPGGAPSTVAERAVGINGWTDRSLEVSGDDNVLTYEDSNVVVDRIGNHNGNTGDTETSGLNVVDAGDSVVRSGPSVSAAGVPQPPPVDASVGSAMPWTRGASVSVADANGVATATGADSLVIGGDGVEDRAVRLRGNRNIATYDDGNVAVGGVGDVNAQIGDSDTSGAVAMGIRNSYVESGASYLPGQPAGDPSVIAAGR